MYRDEDEFTELLQQLRNNDADCTSVSFLNDPSSNNDDAAAALGDALSDSSYVTSLRITIHQLHVDGQYDSLLSYIAMSSTLQQIELDGYGDFTLPTVPPGVTERFLRAIQCSTSIQSVDLTGCFFLSDIVMSEFLSTARSIRELEMDCASFVTTSNESHAVVPVHVAFRDCDTLERLQFEITTFTLPSVLEIIDSLAYNRTLRHLVLETSLLEGEAIIETTGRLLEQSQTLQQLELRDFVFHSVNFGFDPIARALCTGSHSVRWLSLANCRFDHTTTHQLEEALAHSHIETLSLSRTHLGSNNALIFAALANIVRESPMLKHLELESTVCSEPVQNIEEFIDAVKGSKLSHLSLDTSQECRLVNLLIVSLPVIQYLKCLRLRSPFNEARRSILMASLRRNSSLVQVEIVPGGALLPDDYRTVERYAERNRGIQSWLQTITEVKTTQAEREWLLLCPRVFVQLATCDKGPTWIFNTLLILTDSLCCDKPVHEKCS